MFGNIFSPRLFRFLVIFAPLFSPALATASIWNVPGDAATIQGGINLASQGDTVLVGPGTWSGGGNVNLSFGGVDLVLLSSAGRDVTTINCGSSSRALVFQSGESAAAVVQGFTIRDGAADTGGGMLIDEASPIVRDCRFVSCFATYHGGAADLQITSAPRFEDCVFDSNSTSGAYHTGGAVQLLDDGSFVRCSFSDNQSEGIGGAIRMLDADYITFEEGTFGRNTGTDGGALAIQSSLTTDFESCTFIENYTSSAGGALLLGPGQHTFTECLFDQNSSVYGGVARISLGDAYLQNCTVARTTSDSTSAALWITNAGSEIHLYNSIIYGSVLGAALKCTNYADVTPVCSNLFGNAGGNWDQSCGAGEDTLNGNFSLDPLFCDPDNGDFRLDADSPCLDAPGCGLVGAFGQGCGQVSGVAGPKALAPNLIELVPAAPNPFNPSTRIVYKIPAEAGERPVRLKIHDVRGRLVRELVDERQAAGWHTVSWDGTNQAGAAVAGGVYFYRLMLNGETQTRRMILVR